MPKFFQCAPPGDQVKDAHGSLGLVHGLARLDVSRLAQDDKRSADGQHASA